MDDIDKTILVEKFEELIESCENNDQDQLSIIVGIAKGALLEENVTELFEICTTYAEKRILLLSNECDPNENFNE